MRGRIRQSPVVSGTKPGKYLSRPLDTGENSAIITDGVGSPMTDYFLRSLLFEEQHLGDCRLNREVLAHLTQTSHLSKNDKPIQEEKQ